MQIPETFLPFPKPTIVVVSDSTQAKLYFANERLFEFKEELSSDYPSKDNVERYSMKAPSGAHSAEQSEATKVHSRELLYKQINDRLMALDAEGGYEALVICAPQEHLKELQESLHMKLYKRTEIWIPKLLTHEEPLDLIGIIQEMG